MNKEQHHSSSSTPRNKRRSRRHVPKRGNKLFAYRNALGLGPSIAVAMLDVSEVGIRLVLKELACT